MSSKFSSDPSTWPQAPVVLVTGANGGVGYGIALRLLLQLKHSSQSDLPSSHSEFATPNGLTLVLGCRNTIKAHNATLALLREVGKKPRATEAVHSSRLGFRIDRNWRNQRKKMVLLNDTSGAEEGEWLSEEAYTNRWIKNLRVEFVPLDLSSVDSVWSCVDQINSRYPYLSHIFLNAGTGPFERIDYWGALHQFLHKGFLSVVTFPHYIIERKDGGGLTGDGLGWTWQCNVFSHYLLARELLPTLAKSPFESARVIWTTSIDGRPEYYDHTDPYCLRSNFTYASSKFSCGLIGWGFNSLVSQLAAENQDLVKIKSFVVHPGVVAGNMFIDILGTFFDFCMKMTFYIARLLGSTHHVLSPFKCALAFTFVALSPLSLLDPSKPIRYGAKCSRWGKEFVGVDSVKERMEGEEVDPERWWDEDFARDTVKDCERLRTALALKSLTPVQRECKD